MQKIRFFSFCLLSIVHCLLLTANAQKGLHVGIRYIPQQVWLLNGNDDPANYATKWGLATGIITGFELEDNFGMQINFFTSSQGNKLHDLGILDGVGENFITDTTGTFEQKLNYVKLALLFKFNSTPSRRGNQMSFFIGPQIGFLTQASHFINDKLVDYPFETEDLYEEIDAAIVFGLGPNFKIVPNLYFIVNVRFDISIFDIENKDFEYNGDKYWGPARIEGTLSATAGVMLGLTYTFFSFRTKTRIITPDF